LWGRIEVDLDEGKYSVKVKSTFDVSKWDGEKHFVVSTANSLGGRAFALPITLFVGAGFSLLSGVALLVAKHMHTKSNEVQQDESASKYLEPASSLRQSFDDTPLHVTPQLLNATHDKTAKPLLQVTPRSTNPYLNTPPERSD
jgi:hypothetical protein